MQILRVVPGQTRKDPDISILYFQTENNKTINN